jgi:hypothetical protein
LVVQSLDWSLLLQLSQRTLQSCWQFLWQLLALPPNLPLDVASAAQLSVHCSTQISRELLTAMASHCREQDSLRDCLQVVVSDSVQLALHMLNVFCAQTCSTDVTEQVVMHS